MAKQDKKIPLLDELTRTPNITLACNNVGISRETYYRWIRDYEFRRLVSKAKKYGESYVNDVAESALLKKIKEGHWQSIRYRLDKKSFKYMASIPESNNTTPRTAVEDEDFWNMIEDYRLDQDVDN